MRGGGGGGGGVDGFVRSPRQSEGIVRGHNQRSYIDLWHNVQNDAKGSKTVITK